MIKALTSLIVSLGMWLPVLCEFVATLADLLHPLVLYLGVIIALAELALVIWKAWRTRKNHIPMCLILAGVGAAAFTIGGLASVQFLHDSGYLVFATGHVTQSIISLWNHFRH